MNAGAAIPISAEVCKRVWIDSLNKTDTELRYTWFNPLSARVKPVVIMAPANGPCLEHWGMLDFPVPTTPPLLLINWADELSVRYAELVGVAGKHYEPSKSITLWEHPTEFEVWGDELSEYYVEFVETGEEYYQIGSSTALSETLAEIDEHTELLLDEKTKDMCRKHGLLPYIRQIRNRIYDTYQGVSSVEQEGTEDPEIPDCEKVCFEIHLTGEPTQILEDEEKFYAFFFKEVPKEKQQFFTFTYCVL